MSEYPSELLTEGREPDPEFAGEELLYRRFHPDALEDGELGVDAIALPDMSVNRGKYSRPEWVIIEEDFAGWGVMQFQVEDIPTPMQHVEHTYEFGPVHSPQRRNYSHSEVRALEDGRHVQDKTRCEEAWAVRWRRRLLHKTRVRIEPKSVLGPIRYKK